MIQLMQKVITALIFKYCRLCYQGRLSFNAITQVLPCYSYTIYNQAQVTMCPARNVLTG